MGVVKKSEVGWERSGGVSEIWKNGVNWENGVGRGGGLRKVRKRGGSRPGWGHADC